MTELHDDDDDDDDRSAKNNAYHRRPAIATSRTVVGFPSLLVSPRLRRSRVFESGKGVRQVNASQRKSAISRRDLLRTGKKVDSLEDQHVGCYIKPQNHKKHEHEQVKDPSITLRIKREFIQTTAHTTIL